MFLLDFNVVLFLKPVQKEKTSSPELQGAEGFCNYLYQKQTLNAEIGLA